MILFSMKLRNNQYVLQYYVSVYKYSILTNLCLEIFCLTIKLDDKCETTECWTSEFCCIDILYFITN